MSSEAGAPKTNVTFRDMLPGEEAHLVNLIVSIWERTSIAKLIQDRVGRINGHDWTEHKTDEIMADLNNSDVVVVGHCDADIIACATIHYDHKYAIGRVGHFGVARECQGQGVGRMLMDNVLARMRKDGMKYARIEALDTNFPALHLYKSAGFEEITKQSCLLREL